MENNRYEQKEAGPQQRLSGGEETFEKWRRTIGLFLGPLVAVALYFLPMRTLSSRAHVLSAIIGWIVVWWVTEPVPISVTALLGPLLCVLAGVADFSTTFAPFSDQVIFLFMGSFILAAAMTRHGLDRRFAYNLLGLKWIGASTFRILFVFGAIAAFLSMWISNTAATAMLFPIGLGIINAVADIVSCQRGVKLQAGSLRFGTGMMLMAAYAASVGGIGTPVGTPPNIIGISMIREHAKITIPFFRWMTFAFPLMLVMYLLLFVVIYLMHRPEVSRIEGCQDYIRQERGKLGRWTAGQVNSLLAFGVTVALWLIPGFLALLFGAKSRLYQSYNMHMPEGLAALVGAFLLFVLPVDWKKREFTIAWRQAVKIDWGTLLLFGGGLALGNLMFKTGLAEAIGNGLLRLSGAASVWAVTLASIYIAILVSEATSNTAAANMVVPVMIALALKAHINPLPPALGATLGASWGFMLPISTPPNAIVYGSGLVPITKMMKTGIVFDLLGGFLIWIGLRLLLPLTGLI